MELHQVFAIHLEDALKDVSANRGKRGPFGFHLVTLNPTSQCTQEICEMYDALLQELITRDEKLALSDLRQVFYDLNVLFGACLSYPGESTRLSWSKMEATRFLTIWHYAWKAIKRPGTARSECIKNLRALALIHTSQINNEFRSVLKTLEELDFSTNEREDEMHVDLVEVIDDSDLQLLGIADDDFIDDTALVSEDPDLLAGVGFLEDTALDCDASVPDYGPTPTRIEQIDSDTETEPEAMAESQVFAVGMCMPDQSSDEEGAAEDEGAAGDEGDAEEGAAEDEGAAGDEVDLAIAQAERVPLVDSQQHKADRVEVRKEAKLRNKGGRRPSSLKRALGEKNAKVRKTSSKTSSTSVKMRRLKKKQPVPLIPPQQACQIRIMQQREDTLYQLRQQGRAVCQTSKNMFGGAAKEYADILKTMFDAGRSKKDLNRKRKEWKANPAAD